MNPAACPAYAYPHPPFEHHSTSPGGLPCTHRPYPSNAIQADGFTYERSAIEQWLKTHNTSPATGLELESKQLNPNYSLRSLIRDSGHEAGV